MMKIHALHVSDQIRPQPFLRHFSSTMDQPPRYEDPEWQREHVRNQKKEVVLWPSIFYESHLSC
jgi:hypothetical protein